MTSKQKCTLHAQATLPRLRELTFGCEVESLINDAVPNSYIISDRGGICEIEIADCQSFIPLDTVKIIGHTPTLGDWLELLGKKNGGDLQLGEAHIAGVSLYIQPDPTKNFFKFNLATSEPATEKDWDTLAELLNL